MNIGGEMRLNDRQLKILEDLYYSPLPIDIGEMITKYDVSIRTIRYDISKIKKYIKTKYKIQIENKRGKGYYIKPRDKIIIVDLFEEDEEIITKRIGNLILAVCLNNEKLSIEEISEKIFFSTSTIRNLIKELNETNTLTILIDEDRKLIFDNTEKEVRNITTEYLVKDILKGHQGINNIYILEELSKYFDNKLIKKIIRKINNVNKKYNIWISNYAYISELIYLAISNVRYIHNKYIIDEDYSRNLLKKEYQYSKEIVKEIIDIEINEQEIVLFMNFIISKGVFIDPKEITDINFTNALENMISFFSKSELNNLDIDTLRKDISRHLGQFIKKNETGFIEDENPLLLEIKNDYPLYFNIASGAYKIFMEDMNLAYSESEVSYIAIYLYKNNKGKQNKKYRVVTVCGTGRGLAKLLQTRLENAFNNIEIVNNLSSYHFISNKEINNVDFIVSTVDLPTVNKDVIVVSSFLGRSDIRKIREYIDYGNTVQSIPFKAVEETNVKSSSIYRNMAKEYSDIFLKLYDLILEIPDEYKVNEEKMLGLTIHLIIAIPRIIDHEPDNLELLEELSKIEKNHNKVSKVLERFFSYLEKKLNVKLNIQEKYAFYQYIV